MAMSIVRDKKRRAVAVLCFQRVKGLECVFCQITQQRVRLRRMRCERARTRVALRNSTPLSTTKVIV